jgi:cysteine synthase A
MLKAGTYDECLDIDTEDAWKAARDLAHLDGVFIGTSSAAALLAATQVAERPENAGKNIVVIMPDNGYKYLSTGMYAGGEDGAN